MQNSVTGKLSGSEQKPDGKTGPNRYTSGFFQGAELSVILYNERNPAAGIKCAAVTRQTDGVPVCFAVCGNKGNEKMKRTIQYKIGILEDGLTVKQFLKRKHYSGQNLVQLKKYEQGILINNMPAYVIHHLKEGDILTVNIWEEKVSEKIPPVPLPLHIVYEDEDLMVLDKAADMPVHPSMNNYENSLANGLAWYFSSQGVPFIFRCVNRLDRDTTGLTIIAKHMVSSSILSVMASGVK